MICRNCNSVIRDGSEVCHICGAPQYDMQPQNTDPKDAVELLNSLSIEEK